MKFIKVMIGNGKKVHLMVEGHLLTFCALGGDITQVTDDATCKSCLEELAELKQIDPEKYGQIEIKP